MADQGKFGPSAQNGPPSEAPDNGRKLLEQGSMQVALAPFPRRCCLRKPPQKQGRVGLPCSSGFNNQGVETDPIALADACSV